MADGPPLRVHARPTGGRTRVQRSAHLERSGSSRRRVQCVRGPRHHRRRTARGGGSRRPTRATRQCLPSPIAQHGYLSGLVRPPLDASHKRGRRDASASSSSHGSPAGSVGSFAGRSGIRSSQMSRSSSGPNCTSGQVPGAQLDRWVGSSSRELADEGSGVSSSAPSARTYTRLSSSPQASRATPSERR